MTRLQGQIRFQMNLLKKTVNILQLVLSFFNIALKKGLSLRTGVLTILSQYTEGPIKDPENHRGICIMNSLLKLLCNNLHNRLIKFSFDHKLINREQIGFQKDNRTADHLYTLKSLVNKYVSEKSRKIICMLH